MPFDALSTNISTTRITRLYIFFSAIKIPATNPDEVAFSLIAIVDPVSRGAQKLGPILKTLQQSLNCDIKVFLNCLDKNSDMPLKRYISQMEMFDQLFVYLKRIRDVSASIGSYLNPNYNSPPMVMLMEP